MIRALWKGSDNDQDTMLEKMMDNELAVCS